VRSLLYPIRVIQRGSNVVKDRIPAATGCYGQGGATSSPTVKAQEMGGHGARKMSAPGGERRPESWLGS
jgi:hypothetical protein